MRAVPGACCRPLHRTVATEENFQKAGLLRIQPALAQHEGGVRCALCKVTLPAGKSRGFLRCVRKARVFALALALATCKAEHTRTTAPFRAISHPAAAPAGHPAQPPALKQRQMQGSRIVNAGSGVALPLHAPTGGMFHAGHRLYRPQANRYSGNHIGRCKTLPCRPLCRAGAACTR